MKLQLDSKYDIFLMLVLVAKVTFVILALRIKYYEHSNSKSNEELNIIYKRQEIVDFIALLLIYILLLYIFFPRKKTADIKIGHHEQIIFFALGIIGLLHLDWSVPATIVESISNKTVFRDLYTSYTDTEHISSKLI